MVTARRSSKKTILLSLYLIQPLILKKQTFQSHGPFSLMRNDNSLTLISSFTSVSHPFVKILWNKQDFLLPNQMHLKCELLLLRYRTKANKLLCYTISILLIHWNASNHEKFTYYLSLFNFYHRKNSTSNPEKLGEKKRRIAIGLLPLAGLVGVGFLLFVGWGCLLVAPEL